MVPRVWWEINKDRETLCTAGGAIDGGHIDRIPERKERRKQLEDSVNCILVSRESRMVYNRGSIEALI
jgi:hypothetical protein